SRSLSSRGTFSPTAICFRCCTGYQRRPFLPISSLLQVPRYDELRCARSVCERFRICCSFRISVACAPAVDGRHRPDYLIAGRCTVLLSDLPDGEAEACTVITDIVKDDRKLKTKNIAFPSSRSGDRE